MSKTILAYGGFSETQIKNRADIPSSSDINISGSNINCDNIKLSDVKSTIGETTNSLSNLCGSSLVNKYSGFSPIEWYAVSNTFYSRAKTPYLFGNWAGYDKDASAPYITDRTTER